MRRGEAKVPLGWERMVILIICLHTEQSGGIYTILQKSKSGKPVQRRASLHISRSRNKTSKAPSMNNLHHPRRELRSSDPPDLA
jgi:hypothetical protein